MSLSSNVDALALRLAEEVNALRAEIAAAAGDGTDAVWTQVTQAEYDALSPPDSNTLYVIVG